MADNADKVTFKISDGQGKTRGAVVNLAEVHGTFAPQSGTTNMQCNMRGQHEPPPPAPDSPTSALHKRSGKESLAIASYNIDCVLNSNAQPDPFPDGTPMQCQAVSCLPQ